MKINSSYENSPFKTLISFHKVLETLKEISDSEIEFQANYARSLLQEIQKYPELIKGIENIEEVKRYEPIIAVLLADLFPKSLTHNEIKAITIPFNTHTFNHTERFKKILREAREDFEFNLRDFSDEHFYILNCCVILRQYFGYKTGAIDTPIFLDIPDKSNIIHHYRVLFNADFLDIIPTDRAIMLSEEDIVELMDNFHDIELWKVKFPEQSWILKGFSVMTLFDATIENAVSSFKSNLLTEDSLTQFVEIEKIFKSIYQIEDLKIGLTIFGQTRKKYDLKVVEKQIYSHLLFDSTVEECESMLCNETMEKLVKDREFLVVSDIDQYFSNNPDFINQLKKQNVKSFIFVPLVEDNKLLGLLELSSSKVRALNSVNANKLNFVLPFIKEKVSKAFSETENQIEAIIQKEYTSIHPSVKWRFQEEALQYLNDRGVGQEYTLKDIVFKDVYPLYGQIDVQGSSDSRNRAIQEDLKAQINTLQLILERINNIDKLPFIDQKLFELQNFLAELELIFLTDSEHKILTYIRKEINPILSNFVINNKQDELNVELINSYFREVDSNNGAFYQSRKMFDQSIATINKKLAALIDEKQAEAQSYFPHYYERFKTDGIEHNMYIGASIAPAYNFEKYYLYNLRLWQMQVMCEMENYFQSLRPGLSYDLEVSSLILVFSTPISIRFRMDEKQFDIDGSYNVRYEIAKKRIDKARIKNSKERITQKGKLTIVYSQMQEENEYMGYIKLLQHKGLLTQQVEKLEIENLQGLMGMKALRVGIGYYQPENKVYQQYEKIKT